MQDLSFKGKLTGSASLKMLLKPQQPYIAAWQERSVLARDALSGKQSFLAPEMALSQRIKT